VAVYTDMARVRQVAPAGLVINETTKPSLAAVQDFITETNAQIDVALGDAVADANLQLVFRKRATREVVYQIYSSKGAEVTGGEDEQKKTSPLWSRWHKEFEDMLTKIEQRSFTSLLSDTDGPESETMGAEDDSDEDNFGPTFTLEEEF